MTTYQRHGRVPPKRHTQLWHEDRLLTEEVVGLAGFEGPSSILYHLYQPMRLTAISPFRPIVREEWVPDSYTHHLFDTWGVEPDGDALSGRRLLMWNRDVELSLARFARPMEGFYRNGEGDEILFVHEGRGVVETTLGHVPYREGDYVVLPRGITYRVVPDGDAPQRHLVVTSPGLVEIPTRYRNAYGQLLEHAPFHNRDLHGPTELITHDESGEFALTLRVRDGLQEYLLPHHPFDVVGWDGYLYPYTLNIRDFEPITKQVHAPPSVHETFAGRDFVVCSFCPRPLDWHDDAIPIPYNHANLNSEEVIYYVAGDFGSRKDVGAGSVTLHPSGLTHGPQPGLAEASLGTRHTEELAVMLDTSRPLRLTAFAAGLGRSDYAWSWSTAPAAGATEGLPSIP